MGKQITQLPAATTLTGSDVVLVQQAGITKQASVSLVAPAVTDASLLTSGTLAAARLPGTTGAVLSSVGSNVMALSTTGIAAGAYGSGSLIPIINVGADGRILSAVPTAVVLPQAFSTLQGTLLTAQQAVLTSASIAALTATGTSQFSTAQATLLTAQLATLTSAAIDSLTVGGIASFATSQAQLVTAQRAALTSADISALTATGVARFSTAQATLLTAQQATLTSASIASLTATGIASFATSQAALVTAQQATLTSASIASLTATGLTTLAAVTEGVNAAGTVGASSTLSIGSNTEITATLTSATPCTFTMPSVAGGKSFQLLLRQPASGSATTATFTGVRWSGGTAPTITATLGRMDILSFKSDGTNWYGSFLQNFTY